VRLSDIMSAMRLGTYAEVALVLFMLAFVAIGVNVFLRRNAGTWERARHLPLEPEHLPAPTPPTRDVPTLTSRR
jgi:hypothetical protein